MQSSSLPVCEFSKLPATKVCLHQACDQVPFLCSGECVAHACTKLHKHNGEFRLIDYSALQQLVSKLEDPNKVQQQLIQTVSASITRLIESLKLMMQRFRITLTSKDMTFRSSMVMISTLGKIKQHQFSKLTGRELSKLVDSAASQNQAEIQTKLRSEKSKITNIIQSVEQLVNYYHGAYDFREKSQKYLNEAIRMSAAQPKDSLAQYTKAIEFNPNNSIAIIGRAQLYAQLGQYDKALADYDRVLNLDPNNHFVHNAKGMILYDQFNKYKQSISCFSRAIVLNPLQVSYLLNRCNAHTDTGNYRSALQDVNQILENKANESWFYLKRAQIKRKLNMNESAEEDERKAEEIKGRNMK